MPKSKMTAILKVTPSKDDKPLPGRNEPCPCGSKLKFKKCCGLKYSNYVSAKLVEAHKRFGC